ncbi:TPA: hypothetical protein N0F65_004002 [Lagenidium giganteum]|uniref:Cyclic nucleotide-binding domain-containing protein n=1 Tax=Lagenidium giganteum TaxID=4803 RepID=A0AAV2YYY2_9STRA|nr:TPA: hypothetical protein N0F65_004002 [Lagenidium giganteum]
MADRKGSDRKSGKVQPADLPAREGRRLSVAEQVANVPRRVSNALLEIYHLIARHQEQQRQQQRRWWSPILLKNAIDAESNLRMWWLLALQLNLMYNWMVIPLQLAFSLLDQPSWYVIIFNTIADVVLWLDLYFNCNLSYTENLEKIYDTTRIVQRYLRGAFLFDLACVMPYWVIAPTVHHAALRIPRLLRVWHVQRHFVEVDEHFQLNSKRRLMLFGVLLVMLYHIIACLHFSITYKEGFGDAVNDTWIPSDDINLTQINDTTFVLGTDYYDASDAEIGYIASMQYFRSLYYAANVLTALGRTIEPATNVQYGVALVFMLSGFFITAIVVDNVQKRFTASAFEQKEFFATRSRIQLFLRRQNAPLSIHKRVNAFLDFWWSSHRGAVIGELLEELPESIKREVMHSICKPALQTLALLVGVRPVLAQLQHVFVENVKFILYGQGEIIYRQGDYASGIFFLLEGEVCVIATISGCILLFVSREHLQALHRPFGTLSEALLALERRLLDPKIAKASELGSTTRRKGRNFLMRRLFGDLEFCFDPDSIHILTWETWVFLAMTIQWATVMFHICFGVSAHNRTLVDVIMVLLELTFVLDMFIRSHLGYYEFGNKVMDIRVIQRRYFHSLEFMIDLIALLPLYIINWSTTADNRLELLNVNKLFRLFKVPGQFTALQNKYLKVTLELRLFKLVYYAFMVSHLCGCIWFDFASHSSGVRAGSVNETSFGEYKWLPPEKLKNETLNVQYFASLFWSFGLMSASSPGELPKTTSHCIFSVITMTCGFFLFAYVIAIEDQMKTYFFFKRFHSITQEYLLERCLPPSLLTDIRMVHLQPMIVKVSFLAGMEGSVTRMLVSQFNQVLIVRDEFVYKFGEEGSDMYFVFTGLLDTLLPLDEFMRESSVFERKTSLSIAFKNRLDDEDDKSPSKRKHSQSSRLLNTTNSTQMTETSHTAQSKFKMPKLVSALLHGTAAQNGPHLLWLKLIIFTTLYVAILVPYRIAFDSMERAEWLPDLLREIELFCEFVFIWDIWVNWRLKESVESMELYEQDHRQAYRKERIIWDLLAAVPVDYILSSVVESP